MEIYKDRWKKARNLMREQELSFLVLTPSADLFYMTGYGRPATDRFTAFLLTEERAFFLYPALEKNHLADLCEQAEPVSWSDEENPFAILEDLLKAATDSAKMGHRCKGAVGFMTRGGWLLQMMKPDPDITWCDGNIIMEELRSVKSAEEIEIIRTAQKMAEHALMSLLDSGLEGKTVTQVSQELMELRLREGFDLVGPGLIACGADSASPHPALSDYRISRGDTVMFDIGGLYHGYHADMTRTCAVGYASDYFMELYEIVWKAHMAAMDAAAPKVPCGAMDFAARNVIKEAGYGAYFTHRLGHGIGLDIHETPYASAGNTAVLKPGNVLSNEPGIYLPGRFGIRIEDLIVITETGAESLNLMTRSLLIV